MDGCRALVCVTGGVAYCNLTVSTAFRYWAAGVDGSSIGHVGGTEIKTCSS